MKEELEKILEVISSLEEKKKNSQDSEEIKMLDRFIIRLKESISIYSW